jgi:hypothetical protein
MNHECSAAKAAESERAPLECNVHPAAFEHCVAGFGFSSKVHCAVFFRSPRNRESVRAQT